MQEKRFIWLMILEVGSQDWAVTLTWSLRSFWLYPNLGGGIMVGAGARGRENSHSKTESQRISGARLVLFITTFPGGN